MRMIVPKCPACGGNYDGQIRSGVLTCEYCGARFAFDEDELEAFGVSDGEDVADEEEEWEDFEPYEDFTREAVRKFLKKVDPGDFKETRKIVDGLGIGADEEIFIIHDDTIFNSGKNGFAITDYGFYCRDMGDSQSHVLSWGEFAESDEPYIDDSYIKSDGVSVAYFTGSDDVRDQLKSLYGKIYEYAVKFDWSD